jgi:hypothetical protein
MRSAVAQRTSSDSSANNDADAQKGLSAQKGALCSKGAGNLLSPSSTLDQLCRQSLTEVQVPVEERKHFDPATLGTGMIVNWEVRHHPPVRGGVSIRAVAQARLRGYLSRPANFAPRSPSNARGFFLPPGRSHIAGMVKITISAAAFAALAETLPLGSVLTRLPFRACRWRN